MSKLAINVDGLLFTNPFVIGSGPPSTNAKIMSKAFKAGWGGVVAKTTSLTDNEVINVQPRYGKLRSKSRDNVGFQNIELISDASFEKWEDWYKEVKDLHRIHSHLDRYLEQLDHYLPFPTLFWMMSHNQSPRPIAKNA